LSVEVQTVKRLRWVARLAFISVVALLTVLVEPGENPDATASVACPAFYRQLESENEQVFTALLAGCESPLQSVAQRTLDSVRRVIELRASEQRTGSDLIDEINQLIFSELMARPVLGVYLDLGTETKVLVGSSVSIFEVSSDRVNAVVFGISERLHSLSRDESALVVDALERVLHERGIGSLGKEATIEFRRQLAEEINKALGAPKVDDVFLRDYVISEPL
jgi:hypothetical protein